MSDLKAGRLVRLFGWEVETGEGSRVLTTPDYSDKPAVAESRRWIRHEGEQSAGV